MVQRLLPRLMAALLAGLCIAPAAQAGLFDDEEARARVNALRNEMGSRLDKLEASARAQLELANQIEQLKTEIARLRGENEVLSNDLANAIKRQKDFYVDLDNRLRKLEPAPAEARPDARADPQGPAAKVDPAQEPRDYETALAGLKASKFKEAGAAFVAFIKAYPNSSLIASAHYWGAYAHAQARDHAAAAELFGKFAASWPNDERAPAALESRIASLEALKDWKNARAALELLAEKYPNSEPGKKAKLKLKKK